MAEVPSPIVIACALIEDGAGRVLLVRKRGTAAFMQIGGKIEPGESAAGALCREMREEIGLVLAEAAPRPLGRIRAAAANEPGREIEAELFHVRTAHAPLPAAEIAEAIWIDYRSAADLPLAPLTRDHVLPLARALDMHG